MKITTEMRKAGIVAISNLQNTNGSWPCHVRVNDIRADLNMRLLDEMHSSNIQADYWEPALANPTCFLISSVVQTTDGQTRVDVAKHIDLAIMSCDMHFGKTEEEAYRMFYVENAGRKNMDKNANFRAAYRANQEWAVTVFNAITKYKYTCKLSAVTNGHKNRPDLPNIGPLELAWKHKQLCRLLEVLKAWYDKDLKQLQRPANGCSFLRGLIDLLLIQHDTPTKQLVLALSKMSADQIKREAGRLAVKSNTRTDRGHYHEVFAKLWAKYQPEVNLLKRAA